MKSFTAVAAVAALLAGISVASAQSSTMGKDKADTMSKGSMGTSAQVIGTGKYCVKDASGALDCKYASLDTCQQDAKGQTCSANPNSGTTGAK
jgi:hypothetical protein